MPYTPKQRRFFHEIEENPDAARRHGMTQDEGRRLATEADDLARQGKEKKEKAKALPARHIRQPLPTQTTGMFIDLGTIFNPPRQ